MKKIDFTDDEIKEIERLIYDYKEEDDEEECTSWDDDEWEQLDFFKKKDNFSRKDLKDLKII